MRETDNTPERFWGLADYERRWVGVQPYLETRGYQLRPRYRQGWQPSWPEGTSALGIIGAEDVIGMHPGGDVLDAVRISDGKAVAIKCAPARTQEVQIGLFLSSEPLRSDPGNHCVPFLDTFPDPRDDEHVFIVMPLLRRWDDPPLRTVGEFLSLLEQVLEGVQFMHSNHVAHRDAASPNIMMDASDMYPDGFHPGDPSLAKDFPKHIYPKVLSRTQAPPKYYLTDFGISSQFPGSGSRSLVTGTSGRARAPELSATEPYDPFGVDIFGIGEFITEAVQEFRGLGCLTPLAQSMTQTSPQSRPTAEKALAEFRQLRQSLPAWRSLKLLPSREQGSFARIGSTIYETFRLPVVVAGEVARGFTSRFRSTILRR